MNIPVRCSACQKNINTEVIPYFAAKCCLCWNDDETVDGWTQWWQDNFTMWEIARFKLRLPTGSYRQELETTYKNCLRAVSYYTIGTKKYVLPFNILFKSKSIKAKRERFMEFVSSVTKAMYSDSCGELRNTLKKVRKVVG